MLDPHTETGYFKRMSETPVSPDSTLRAIHLLSSEVVDQIAAGEVVERPSHLVKELVENSLDAGAKSIEIEFDQGGRRVRITDDGCGILPDQLKLALARHATSKIAQANDLWSLNSFGFRGEALASIAAVSRLTLQSRTRDAANASRVTAEFGRVSPVEPSGGNFGTTILIEDLFENLPARLKFMKSEAGETAQIKSTLRSIALANEGVEFRLRTKGKLDQHWPACDSFLERARQILTVDKLYENNFEYQGFHAHVVFAGPHDVTGNARAILTFVQKRVVQDRGLQAAVIDAFRGLLMHGEYPIAVARLTAPLDEIDVNIHPTKSQVKFRDNQTAFRAVNRCLREAIEKAPWLESKPVVVAVPSAPNSFGTTSSATKLSVADLTRPYSAGEALTKQDVFGSNSIRSVLESAAAAPPVETLAVSPVFSTGRFEAPEFSTVQFRQKQDVVAESAPVEAAGPWSRLQVLGQAHLTYIVTQDNDRMVLVDQHAAHERVAYERLMRAWTSGQVDVQTLLIPISVDLEPDGAEALVSIAGELEKLGVVLEQTGPQSVGISARPSIIKDSALIPTLKTLAREIVEKGGSFSLEKKIGDLCATMACHSVVRAGQALSLDQMRSLLKQMDEFALSSFCPHGRPVSVDYPFAKLERDFGRIV